MRRVIYVGIIMLWSLMSWSQDTARIMFYNVLEFPEAPPNNRELILKNIIDEIQPDVLMVAELQDQNGADLILNQSLNATQNNFTSAPFVFNTSGNGGSINQLLYFNTEKFSLELTDIIQTSLRDINRYQLKAITDQSQTNPIILEFFVAHFKASQGSFNEQIRFDMALAFTNYINTNLSADANVIFAGDFNFYDANESGFQQLFIGSTIIPMNDPVNQLGDWHTNSSFSAVHTQSTRESNNSFNDYGAGGGLDDRFDFMFVSGNMLDDNHDVRYIDDSYVAYGNNGNCYNEDISDTSCSGIFTQNLRNLLWNMSDHLPIAMDLEFEQNFLEINHLVTNDVINLPNGNVPHQELWVEVNPSFLSEIHSLYVFNTLGQQINSIDVSNTNIRIALDDFAKGVYILKTNTGHTLKFIISH